MLQFQDIGHLITGKDINGNLLSESDRQAITSSLIVEASMLAVNSLSKLKLEYANKVNVIEMVDRADSIMDGLEVIDGRVGGKIPIEDYRELRKLSIHNKESDSITLGKYRPTINADGTEIGRC